MDDLTRRASECRIAGAVGVECEVKLAFAAFHLLWAPFLDRLDRLAAAESQALEAVADGLFTVPAKVHPLDTVEDSAVLPIVGFVLGEPGAVAATSGAGRDCSRHKAKAAASGALLRGSIAIGPPLGDFSGIVRPEFAPRLIPRPASAGSYTVWRFD
ncbi:MAG: hypothetical protein ACRDS0_16605 [Pseudonocardiaceae bacterium]